MAINNFSQSFESGELFNQHSRSTSTKKMQIAQRLKHSVPVQISRNEDPEKSIDTQTQRRGVSPQLGDTSSKGNCSPQLIDVSEEQLMSAEAD